jgi:hypothetical protein
MGILRLHGGCRSDKGAAPTRVFSLVRPAFVRGSPDRTRTSLPSPQGGRSAPLNRLASATDGPTSRTFERLTIERSVPWRHIQRSDQQVEATDASEIILSSTHLKHWRIRLATRGPVPAESAVYAQNSQASIRKQAPRATSGLPAGLRTSAGHAHQDWVSRSRSRSVRSRDKTRLIALDSSAG